VGVKYKNPPIEEAVCQFTFAENIPWGIATPGQLFERFQEHYPAEPTQQQLVQANLLNSATGEAPSLSLVQSPTRVQLRSEDDTRRLTVGADLAAVHTLKPYVGFEEELLPRIKRDIAVVVAQFGVTFSRVSLRYINRINVAKATVELKDYFNYITDPIDMLPFNGVVAGFLYRTQLESPQERTACAVTVASLQADPGMTSFLLDIDLTFAAAAPIDLEDALSSLTTLKRQENEIFESLITPTSRKLFNDE